MFNYKLIVQYDGTDFYGWQSQPSGNTIQDEISKSILKLTGEEVGIIGSGRTDSGVHALGQVANFKISKSLDTHKFLHSLNSLLPNSIAVKSIDSVSEDFHSRFDAIQRSYLYLISREKSPFYWRYSYQNRTIDFSHIGRLNEISRSLLGEHDFTSFCKTQTDTENKICQVYDIHWRKQNDLILFYISANRFLHGMVRTIVGTILKSMKESGSDTIQEVLLSKDRNAAGESVPAKGLFLFKVKYN